jgi:serine/threonine protein kinase
MMEGGSVHDIILQRNKRLSLRDTVRIALDVADGLAFMNSYGIAYRDLNSRKILLDRQGNACLGDMGIVTPCNNVGEVTEYETSGFRWLAPEVSFLLDKFTESSYCCLEVVFLKVNVLF